MATSHTVFERLSHWARTRPDDPALIFLASGDDETARWSFQELHSRALAVAGLIQQRGGAAAPVALLYPSGLEFCAALFGCFYAGAVAVPAPFNPRTRMTDRVRSILGNATPSLILTRDEDACRKFEAEGEIWLPTGSLAPTSASAGTADNIARDDRPAFLQYTSGSTGNPKGVIVGHDALACNLQAQRAAFGVDASCVLVNWLPMFHDMGLVGGLLLAVDSGRPCVIMPPLAFLQSPVRWLRAVTRFGGKVSGGPNFAYELCATRLAGQVPHGLDLSSWRSAFCGSEPVRARTLARFAETFAPAGFNPASLMPCYGMAETTLVIATSPIGRGLKVAADNRVSCGPPVGCEVLIVDPETACPVADGQIGEVCVRGGSVARGYWNAPEATAAAFGISIPGNGTDWFRTGDRGYLHEGELYLAGRIKDTIIHRGAKIDAEDIESAAAASVPGLAPAGAAFAIEIGDRECVVLVQEVERRALPLLDPEAAAGAIIEAVAAQTGLRLHDLLLLRPGAIPRTTSGKVQRSICRQLYLAGSLPPAASTEGIRLLLRWQTGGTEWGA